MKKTTTGFTIVELLIVIVVIAILAAISIVAYNGIQQRARDSQRQSDIAAITKALELYYAEKGEFPNAANYTPGSTVINGSWSTTADGSWSNLLDVLKPYAQNLPVSPSGPSTATAAISGGNNYDYVGVSNSNYCGTTRGQMFLLAYKLEGPKQDKTIGVCGGATPLGPYAVASNYRVIK